MTDYMILFPADREDEWDDKTDEERQAVYENDYEFGRLLEQRGGRMTGGAELSSRRLVSRCRRARSSSASPNARFESFASSSRGALESTRLAASSASRISSALRNRRSGSRASARVQISANTAGNDGTNTRGSGIGSTQTARIVSTSESRRKRRRAVSASKSTVPSANTSAR